ncbi:MAG: hypothetical protein AB7F35_24470 [Acetobacteraceae bacterium]
MRFERPYLLTAATFYAMLLIANCTAAQEPFPNVNDAERHLYSALDSLHRAPPEFRGHKAEAVRLIREAIAQLESAKRVAY